MSSVFPGMDPYLEHPVLWAGVHHGLIQYSLSSLNSVLPPRYAADIGERVYVATFEPEQVREPYIQILDLMEGEQVVAAIEFHSPANKTSDSEGRVLYLEKQAEVLGSRTHLLEIDLLRVGQHTVAAPREAIVCRARWDYRVSLSRSGRRGKFEVWPILLEQSLPTIHVPLAEGEPDVTLDLQSVFDRMYDAGPYSRRVDYSGDPFWPLSPDRAEWARSLVQGPDE